MSRSNETYNGWTNYATWRVHLEMFDGMELGTPVSAHDLQDMAEDAVEMTSSEGFARDYAMAFLSDVNWHEIAEHVTACNEDEKEYEDYDLDPDPHAGSEWTGAGGR